MPLATIQQHLFAIQQRTNSYPMMPSPSATSGLPANGGGGNNNNNQQQQQMLPIPFPHHLLSQWTLAAAAGFGLNHLGLFGLGGLPGAGLTGLQQQQQSQSSVNASASVSPSQSTRQPSPMTTTTSTPPSVTATVTGSSVAHLPCLSGERAETASNSILKGHNPSHSRHRFSPYPPAIASSKTHGSSSSNSDAADPSERSPAPAGSKLIFDK
jgi:hypothetical protein